MEDSTKRKTINIEGQHHRYLIKKVNKDKPPEVKKMNISSNLEKELQIHEDKIYKHGFQKSIINMNYIDSKNDEYKYISQHFQKLVKTKMSSYLKQDEQKTTSATFKTLSKSNLALAGVKIHFGKLIVKIKI